MMSAARKNARVLVRAALLTFTVFAAVGLTACRDLPTSPAADAEEQRGSEEPIVLLTVDDSSAPVGSVVRVTARVDVAQEGLTPTDYVVELRFDPASLHPMEAIEFQRDGLRLINLEAGPGRVKAAGAAAEGFRSDVLLEVLMEVKAQDYADALDLEVLELNLVERASSEVAVDAAVHPGAGTNP